MQGGILYQPACKCKCKYTFEIKLFEENAGWADGSMQGGILYQPASFALKPNIKDLAFLAVPPPAAENNQKLSWLQIKLLIIE